jgi:excisionase family DNA binding protein
MVQIGAEMINDDSIIDYNITGRMLTVPEVAKLLHVHSNTARRWADQGIIKAYRISRRGDRRFKREDIARFLNELNSNAKKE